MMNHGTQPAPRGRAAYLAAALELRTMAYRAQSLEMRRDLMRLVVLYEELAEYSSRQGQAEPKDTTGS